MIPFFERVTGYRWNEGAARYINSLGQFVPTGDVRTALDGVIMAQQQNLRNLSQSLIDREISLAQWQNEFAKGVKNLHVTSTTAARGGWGQMTQADWGWAGSQVKNQYVFLRNFAEEIASGAQPLDGRVMVRTNLYAQSGRGSFEQMRRRFLQNTREVVAERRVLGIADHCSSAGGLEGCLELAAKGWQPPGVLPPIGVSPCRANCRCHFEQQLADGMVIY